MGFFPLPYYESTRLLARLASSCLPGCPDDARCDTQVSCSSDTHSAVITESNEPQPQEGAPPADHQFPYVPQACSSASRMKPLGG